MSTENLKDIHLIDTTLRDGEQAPGIIFSRHHKIEIANLISDMGVQELEVGYPILGKNEIEDIKAISKENLKADLSCWARAKEDDIECAADCGLPNVHICFPASKIQLENAGLDEQWVLDNIKYLITKAKKYFSNVSVGAMDATRSGFKLLSDMAEYSKLYGAIRMRIADTVGIAKPSSIKNLIRNLTGIVPDLDIDFHGHNDLGMATANSITAVEAGARALSVTVNGIGERAGNTALEEVVMALKIHYNMCNHIDSTKIFNLCNNVSSITRRPIPLDKPIVGMNAFRHETGIHVSGLLKNPIAFQPFMPDQVGQMRTTFIPGKHTGGSALQHFLKLRGITISRKQALNLIPHVRRKSTDKRRDLTEDEIEAIYHLTQEGEIEKSK